MLCLFVVYVFIIVMFCDSLGKFLVLTVEFVFQIDNGPGSEGDEREENQEA